jgi:hypothetical protein
MLIRLYFSVLIAAVVGTNTRMLNGLNFFLITPLTDYHNVHGVRYQSIARKQLGKHLHLVLHDDNWESIVIANVTIRYWAIA